MTEDQERLRLAERVELLATVMVLLIAAKWSFDDAALEAWRIVERAEKMALDMAWR